MFIFKMDVLSNSNKQINSNTKRRCSHKYIPPRNSPTIDIVYDTIECQKHGIDDDDDLGQKKQRVSE